mgnify:CR=1 FL=1
MSSDGKSCIECPNGFDEEKKNVTDFALWIKAPENHLMKWDTFFGKAYPGWHLECSAMSEKYLGKTL